MPPDCQVSPWDINNSIQGLLRGFGIRLPRLLRGHFEAGVRSMNSGQPVPPDNPGGRRLDARAALRDQLAIFDRRVREAAPQQRGVPSAADGTRRRGRRALTVRRARPAGAARGARRTRGNGDRCMIGRPTAGKPGSTQRPPRSSINLKGRGYQGIGITGWLPSAGQRSRRHQCGTSFVA